MLRSSGQMGQQSSFGGMAPQRQMAPQPAPRPRTPRPPPMIDGRPIPPEPTELLRDPETGRQFTGGRYFNRETWQWEPKPGIFDRPQEGSSNPYINPAMVNAMRGLGMDPNDFAAQQRFKAMVDPRFALWAASARPDIDIPFNAALSDIDPQLKDILLGRMQKEITKRRILDALASGEIQAHGGPRQGTVPSVPPGSVPEATIADALAQRARIAEAIRGIQNQTGGGYRPSPAPAPAGSPPAPPAAPPSGGLDPNLRARFGAIGTPGAVVDYNGRKYRLNKNGAWVDITDPQRRQRVTGRGGRELTPKAK